MSKVRIANYYDNRVSGRNDGNPLYMWNAFKQLGVESGHLVPEGDLTKFGTWDLHFEADWAEDALASMIPYEVQSIPHPSVFWTSDCHLGYDWRLAKAKRTDWNFVAQKRGLDEFVRDGIKDPILMYHAVEPMAYPHISSLKKYDLCFIGHINSGNRIEALDRMFNEVEKIRTVPGKDPAFFYGQRLFEEAAEKYCQSKIVFNISIKDDINMRVFETLSTKSFLLTNWIPTLGDLFEDGKHLVMYKTMDEAVDKMKYYLQHDSEREAIAEEGFKEVRSKHTFFHRAKQVMDTCLPGWDKETSSLLQEAVAV